jgi:hypothetical protein
MVHPGPAQAGPFSLAAPGRAAGVCRIAARRWPAPGSVQLHRVSPWQPTFSALKRVAFLLRHRMRLDRFDARHLSALWTGYGCGRDRRRSLHRHAIRSPFVQGCPSGRTSRTLRQSQFALSQQQVLGSGALIVVAKIGGGSALGQFGEIGCLFPIAVGSARSAQWVLHDLLPIFARGHCEGRACTRQINIWICG